MTMEAGFSVRDNDFTIKRIGSPGFHDPGSFRVCGLALLPYPADLESPHEEECDGPSHQGSGRHGVTLPMVESALKVRRNQPILFVDTAVPCDVEPAVGALDSAFLYSLSDLEAVAQEGKETRETAATWLGHIQRDLAARAN